MRRVLPLRRLGVVLVGACAAGAVVDLVQLLLGCASPVVRLLVAGPVFLVALLSAYRVFCVDEFRDLVSAIVPQKAFRALTRLRILPE
jgi:hypothetical protein